MKCSFDGVLTPQTQLTALMEKLEPYRQRLTQIAQKLDYADPESSIQLPMDEQGFRCIQALVNDLQSPTLQYIIVVGIGGSNLGTQAVYEAIAGSMNLLQDRLPKMIFLDTVSDEKMTAVTRILERMTSHDDYLVIVISKSGTTTETIANMEVLWAFASKHFGEPKKRFVCVTDHGSSLWRAAQTRDMRVIEVPSRVAGRYSVCSSVGLLPLALSGIDIEAFVSGAQEAVHNGLAKKRKNYALKIACLTFLQCEEGRSIHNTFVFSPKFEGLGKWYRQLMGESIGKNGKGMTPIVSVGSTDLHSMAQLYWDGPDNIFTQFVCAFTGNVNMIPTRRAMPELVAGLQGKSLESIMKAIYRGVKATYEQVKRPYVEIDLERADAWELGYYLQFRMLEMMYLGRLLNVNAFDQPAVELYKDVTHDLLEQNKGAHRGV